MRVIYSILLFLALDEVAEAQSISAPPPRRGGGWVLQPTRRQSPNLDAVKDRATPLASQPNNLPVVIDPTQAIRDHAERLDELEARSSALEAKLEKLSGLGERLEEVGATLGKLEARMVSLEKSVGVLESTQHRSVPAWAWIAIALLTALSGAGATFGFVRARGPKGVKFSDSVHNAAVGSESGTVPGSS